MYRQPRGARPFRPAKIPRSSNSISTVVVPSHARLARARDLVHVDVAVRAAREERVAVRAPRERHDPRQARLVLHRRRDLVLHALVLQVPDLDRRVRRGAEPVVLRAEAQRLGRIELFSLNSSRTEYALLKIATLTA